MRNMNTQINEKENMPIRLTQDSLSSKLLSTDKVIIGGLFCDGKRHFDSYHPARVL